MHCGGRRRFHMKNGLDARSLGCLLGDGTWRAGYQDGALLVELARRGERGERRRRHIRAVVIGENQRAGLAPRGDAPDRAASVSQHGVFLLGVARCRWCVGPEIGAQATN